jgi:hypothetical protein
MATGCGQPPFEPPAGFKKGADIMRPIVALQIVVWLAASDFVFAGSFEGAITIKESSEGEVWTHKTYFKGNKVRVDESSGNYTVADAGKKESFATRKEDKTYLVIPWQSGLSREENLVENVTVTRTGKQDKVAGYACEIYLSKDKEDDSTSEVCVARGISNTAYYPWFAMMHQGEVPTWVRDILKDGGFPLRAVDRDESGDIESTEEVVKVEAIKLDDRLFAPPPGFKKVDRGAMMQQFQKQIEQRKAQQDKRR